ncbi:hypothetical protein NC653_020765 [Populus alba x Populus x berolinensis]|uniref:Uncharacterized protein n=1 Tax=Populus alba x Populus x berolinensis TaxID=444605 RepID=A0AAD6QCT6_9ROSI|nr:hypothetical protein NC653_020765 [Populus alba x Populus x berolinensis]
MTRRFKRQQERAETDVEGCYTCPLKCGDLLPQDDTCVAHIGHFFPNFSFLCTTILDLARSGVNFNLMLLDCVFGRWSEHPVQGVWAALLHKVCTYNTLHRDRDKSPSMYLNKGRNDWGTVERQE